jgi:hypothetical protein
MQWISADVLRRENDLWYTGTSMHRASDCHPEAFAYLVAELLKRIEEGGDINVKRETAETRKVWEERLAIIGTEVTFA